MVDRRWVEGVCYYEYTPTTITHEADVDGCIVARADIPSRDSRHRVILAIVVTDRHVLATRILLEGAILRGRTVLEWLVEAHRALADELTTDRSLWFDLGGQRVR